MFCAGGDANPDFQALLRQHVALEIEADFVTKIEREATISIRN